MTKERPAVTTGSFYFRERSASCLPVTYAVELELLREDLTSECRAYLERRAVEVWESAERVRFVFWFEFACPSRVEPGILRWVGVLRWRLMHFGVFRGRIVWNPVFPYGLCLREEREAEFWESELSGMLGSQRN